MTNTTFTLNSMISIKIGGAATYNAVVSGMVHGELVAMTEKALQLKLDNGATVWLPKSALTTSGSFFKLAGWFKMSEYQERALYNNRVFSGVSVS